MLEAKFGDDPLQFGFESSLKHRKSRHSLKYHNFSKFPHQENTKNYGILSCDILQVFILSMDIFYVFFSVDVHP